MQGHIWKSFVCRRFSRALRGPLAFAAVLAAAVCPAVSVAQSQAGPAPAKPAIVQNTAASPAAPASAAAPEQARVESKAARPDGGGMNEGIKVHGHWTIEVKSPDGKLLSHTEFENSLQAAGQLTLAELLSGYVPGDWMITLDGAQGVTYQPGQQSCTNSVTTSGVGPCAIVESGGYMQTVQCPGNGYQCFATLKVGKPTGGTFTLQGTATSGAAGVISDVETLTNVCLPSATPAACETGANFLANYASFGTFSAATLPASNTTSTPCGGTGQISCAVTVPDAGDQISVSVTISFQ